MAKYTATQSAIDDIACQVNRFIDICVARWQLEGEIPDGIKADIEQIQDVIWNHVSARTKDAIIAMSLQTPGGNELQTQQGEG